MTKELWLPTTTTHAQVTEHNVKVWDDVTFELRKVKMPAGIGPVTEPPVKSVEA